MKVKLSDFSEEIIHVVQCPNCKEYIEMREDPSSEQYIFCEDCGTELEILDE